MNWRVLNSFNQLTLVLGVAVRLGKFPTVPLDNLATLTAVFRWLSRKKNCARLKSSRRDLWHPGRTCSFPKKKVSRGKCGNCFDDQIWPVSGHLLKVEKPLVVASRGFILFWCWDRICTCLSTHEKFVNLIFGGENSWLFCQKGEGFENEGLDWGKGEEEEEEKKEQTPKR